MTTIGERILQIRTDRGETQRTVANRAGLQLTTYQRVELGMNQPTVATLKAIADALEVTVDDLLMTSPA